MDPEIRNVLSLDLSTKTGWALFIDNSLKDKGVIELKKRPKEMGPYPFCFAWAADEIGNGVSSLVDIICTNFNGVLTVVIEEVNLARQRLTQKLIDSIHHSVILYLMQKPNLDIHYLSSSEWRKGVSLALSKEDRKNNQKVSRAKAKAKNSEGKVDIKEFNKLKKEIGVSGKKNWKKLAVEMCNQKYNLELKQKDNDIADAILIAEAYLNGTRSIYFAKEGF